VGAAGYRAQAQRDARQAELCASGAVDALSEGDLGTAQRYLQAARARINEAERALQKARLEAA
jgi:hypothetical protein